MGRMLEPAEIVAEVVSWFQPKLLSGARVLVTAGPTFEPIDPVRGITNRSSGKMGFAVARAALESGAAVTLISGPTALEAPAGAELIRVETAQQMFAAVQAQVEQAQIFISVAAVADYYVKNRREQKIKKQDGIPSLELAPTPDIIESVANRKHPPFCVGFAAESENLEGLAQAKRRRKNLPLLAANLVQSAIGTDDNELVLFDDKAVHRSARSSKIDQARLLIRHIAKLFLAEKSALKL